jgi:hypothetical protein
MFLSLVGCVVIGIVIIDGAPVKAAGGTPCTCNDHDEQRGLMMPVCLGGDIQKSISLLSLSSHPTIMKHSLNVPFFGKHLPPGTTHTYTCSRAAFFSASSTERGALNNRAERQRRQSA